MAQQDLGRSHRCVNPRVIRAPYGRLQRPHLNTKYGSAKSRNSMSGPCRSQRSRTAVRHRDPTNLEGSRGEAMATEPSHCL
ncbi:hypothetical protein M8818_002266 [Zalaria obscura]|uniref:Uncharacterized protein n=1 Tax=Zalaria obscura TaxID=2024903 RepID=A0ACC3SJE5_9PEZI